MLPKLLGVFILLVGTTVYSASLNDDDRKDVYDDGFVRDYYRDAYDDYSEEDYSDEDYSDEDYYDDEFYDQDYEPWQDEEWEEELLERFEDLIDENRYDGGVLGVMKNGRLVFAEGYGDMGRHELSPSTLMPISSISKTLTAVGILQLAEQGYLSLEDEVFGDEGILWAYKPVDSVPFDERINEITVDHLLRHAAGWDETRGPTYDPMMNELYLAKEQNVVDIGKAMHAPGFLTQYELIRFMISSPLSFTPGTKSKYSNFGYCVLGRIIEEITEMPYEEYIRKEVLLRAGMMHTRVGPRMLDEDDYDIFTSPYVDDSDDISNINSQYLHTIISPQLLDSTLGWYSNVYDLSRFVRCLFGRHPECELLRPESVHYMLEKPPFYEDVHGDHWRAIAVHADNNGAVWQDSDTYDNDVIVYHKGAPRNNLFQAITAGLEMSKENITVICLTSSNRYKRFKNAMEKFGQYVQNLPIDSESYDIMIEDVSDTELVGYGHDMMIIYDLTEHHIRPYFNALRIQGYYPVWIQAYTWDGISNFVVISEKAKTQEDLRFQVIMEASKKKMYNKVADWEEMGYHVMMAQSYMSFSHDRRAQHWALMTPKPGYERNVLWSLGTDLESYLVDLEVATGKGYSVISQSIETHAHEQFVTYVFHKVESQTGYVAYHDMTLGQLEALVKSSALKEYSLVYLDSYRQDKNAHFSAVFRKGKVNKWVLHTDLERDALPDTAIMYKMKGYLPKFIVGYEEQDHDTKFVGFFVMPDMDSYKDMNKNMIPEDIYEY